MSLTLTLSASDPEGDPVSYSVSGHPEGSTLSDGTFSWTPTFEQAGSYDVIFTTSDGKGGTTSETITIAVTEVNRSPSLTSIDNQTIQEGTQLHLTLAATDPDGDRVTFTVSGNPSGSSLSGTSFTWTPGFDQAGSYSLTFTVSDGKGGSDTETITIVITDASARLEQNCPNPFTSSTVIRFALPESERVELTVYNLMGRKVATLVEGTRQAGEYTVRWNGRDDRGQALASGVYLYQLRAGARVETRKLLLLQ